MPKAENACSHCQQNFAGNIHMIGIFRFILLCCVL